MSLRSLLRSVVEWIRPPRRVEPELRITPEQLRAALSDMLSDPQTRRLVLRDFVGTVFPISGGQCGTAAGTITPGTFGSSCNMGEVRAYTFQPEASGTVPLSVKGFSMQSAVLQQWKKSDDTVLTVVDKDGKLGIGTTAPINKLDVRGSNVNFGVNNIGYISLGQENVTTARYSSRIKLINDTPNTYAAGIAFETADSTPDAISEKMRIHLDGRVGIGTTAPISKLDVRGGNINFGVNNTGYISLGQENVTTARYSSRIKLINDTPNTYAAGISFETADSTPDTISEKMRIGLNGNVGIGTTNPLGKLHVKGGDLYIEGTGGVGVGRLGFLKNGGTVNDGTQMWREGETANQDAPDTVILQTRRLDPTPSTILAIKAPDPTLPGTTDREATLALGRDLAAGGAEFLDFYNNGFAAQTQYGIRIQRRGTDKYRDFVFDQDDNVAQKFIMVVRATRKIGIGTRDTRAKLMVKGESFPATGTVTVSSMTPTTVTGSGTLFLQEVDVGDRVTIGSETRTVTGITDETHLTVDTGFSPATNQTMTVTNHLFRVEDASGNVKVFVSHQGDVGIGTLDPKTKLHGTGSTILGTANAAQVDTDLGNSQVNIWVNESLNQLNFKVKYSNGTVKSASLALA